MRGIVHKRVHLELWMLGESRCVCVCYARELCVGQRVEVRAPSVFGCQGGLLLECRRRKINLVRFGKERAQSPSALLRGLESFDVVILECCFSLPIAGDSACCLIRQWQGCLCIFGVFTGWQFYLTKLDQHNFSGSSGMRIFSKTMSRLPDVSQR